MSEKIISIIPARMGSSRFPGKPMAKILDIPMIGHVYYRVCLNKNIDDVYVATCDEEIYDYIKSINGNVVMTGSHHERCSDRCAEALLKIEKEKNIKYDIVLMVQGDEPLVHPDMLGLAIEPLIKDKKVLVSNLFANIKSLEEFNDPNTIKVVADKENNALYFSREPIPSLKKGSNKHYMKKQVCIIPFQRDFLLEFNNMTPTILEEIESVDMMRVLENGYNVKLVHTDFDSKAVDTIQDLRAVEEIMKQDMIVKEYMRRKK